MPKIVKIDLAAIQAGRKKPTVAKVNTVDTLAMVTAFIPQIGDLNPGEGIYCGPKEFKGLSKESYMAKSRALLTSVRREGQPWAGRVYSTLIQDDGRVLIARADDNFTDILPRKVGGSKPGVKRGPRKPKEAVEGAPVIAGLEAAREHLNGAPSEPNKEVAGTSAPKSDTEIIDLTK